MSSPDGHASAGDRQYLELMTESFAQLFEESLNKIHLQSGELITGEVVHVDDNVVVVNAGLIPAAEFLDNHGQLNVKVGDRVEVVIEMLEDGSGETRLSREKACRAKAWEDLEKAFENQSIVTGVMTGKVKGGYTVAINGVRAFLPSSLVDVRPVRDPSYLEGKELEFKVIKIDRKRNNVVVSRRAVVEKEMSAEREALLAGRSSRGWSRISPTTARSLTLAALTACCTSPISRGSASSTRARCSRLVMRSRPRCSDMTASATAFRSA
jgi:hypothetical protein